MEPFDLLIQGGTVIDGSGRPAFVADVTLRGDRIADVGQLSGASARRTIDARGLVVAPGFVDVHNHSEGWLLKQPYFAPKLSQGFTTEVLLSDGISYAPLTRRLAPDWFVYLRALNGLTLADYRGWETLAEFMQQYEGRTAQNVAFQIPYANTRVMTCGWGRQAVDDTQFQLIDRAIKQGMECGATGISTGLDYIAQCYATTEELVRVCRSLAGDGLYVTHVRYKLGVLDGVKEAVRIGRESGTAVHISHLKALDPSQVEPLLDYIDRVAVNEVDFSFDIYPYMAGSTLVASLLPYSAWEDGPLRAVEKLARPDLRRQMTQLLEAYHLPLDKIRLAWVPSRDGQALCGKTLAEVVALRGGNLARAFADLLIDEQLAVLGVMHVSDDALVEPFLQHPRQMVGSDGIFATPGIVHPRVYGTAARILGPCVRDRKLFSLEEAVRKLSGYPSERFGLVDRGHVVRDAFADLVLFDAATITDLATYEDPHQISRGVQHVLVNGVEVWGDGKAVASPSQPPGRVVRYRQAG